MVFITFVNDFILVLGVISMYKYYYNYRKCALRLTNRSPVLDFLIFIYIRVILVSGQLSKIRIWHDNRYMRAGWFLSVVNITDNGTNETFTFPAERWLAKDEDDGSLMRELPCANDMSASKEHLSITG